MVGLWRSFRTYNAQTVVTAPTMHQCRDVWLKEARLWHERSIPIIKNYIDISLSNVRIMDHPDWGVKLKTSTKPENAQGLHGQGLTIIIEEASGVPREIVSAFLTTLTNKDLLILQIGNPNTRDCAFFDCFNRNKEDWHTITLNAEDTARDYPNIVNPERNERIEKEFGKDSPVYRVCVLGEFPHSDPNTILSSEEVQHCTGAPEKSYQFVLKQRPAECGGGKVRQFGIDFSRFGGDESVIFRRTGNAIVEWHHCVHTEPLFIVNKAFAMQKAAGWSDAETWYVPDANGMGEGMMINFYQASKNVVEFKNQGSAVSDEYDNIITEAWFLFRKMVRAKNCYIPDDPQLIQQLCGRRYYMTNKGKIIIESKDDYMKRNDNQSPDRADALVMAFYDPVQAVGNIATRNSSEHVLGAQVAGGRY